MKTNFVVDVKHPLENGTWRITMLQIFKFNVIDLQCTIPLYWLKIPILEISTINRYLKIKITQQIIPGKLAEFLHKISLF